MPGIINHIAEYFLDMIFPIACLGCGKNREELPARARWICEECMLKISLRSEQVCPGCEQESEGGKTHYACRERIALDGLWAAAYYDGFIEKAVHQFKFNFIRDLAFPLGEMMIQSAASPSEFTEFQDLLMSNSAKEDEEGIFLDETRNAKTETILLPVPLHRRRYNWRGFNQSYLLAQHVGERFGLSVREDILLRAKNTKPQSKTKNEAERRKNIRDAFICVRPEEVRHKNIILIDDVCTTSATLDECARELRIAGAKNIWALVVARR